MTFVFMTGSKLVASEYGQHKLWLLPGYRNTFETSAGSEGMRIIIHSPKTAPYPDLQGIDISPGMATTIGIRSKENNRLAYPYGECATYDIEEDLLIKSMADKHIYKPSGNTGILSSDYSTIQCRSSCLQRYFWEECGCLAISEKIPFFNSSLLCAQEKGEILANPDLYGYEECFELNTILKDKCISLFKKLFSDIKCMQRVFRMTDNVPKEHEKDFACQCPVPCKSREYKLTAGASRWPSPGPELDAAYNRIVKKTIIPYFQNLNSSLTDGPIRYLSNKSNRQEIMENFARVTVYVKSMRGKKIEQIAAYTFIDLISDIGKWHCPQKSIRQT